MPPSATLINGTATSSIAAAATDTTTRTTKAAEGTTDDTKTYITATVVYGDVRSYSSSSSSSSPSSSSSSSSYLVSPSPFPYKYVPLVSTDHNDDDNDNSNNNNNNNNNKLVLPEHVRNVLKNAHGFEVVVTSVAEGEVGKNTDDGGRSSDGSSSRNRRRDVDGIYLTYESVSDSDLLDSTTAIAQAATATATTTSTTHNCLLRWPISGDGVGQIVSLIDDDDDDDNNAANISEPSREESKQSSSTQEQQQQYLCSGEPHGLTLSRERRATTKHQAETSKAIKSSSHDDDDDDIYLYHVNNDAVLTKTSVSTRRIIWQNREIPQTGSNDDGSGSDYRPTWVAVPPDGPYIYLCDGYGSNHVYLMWRHNGTFVIDHHNNRGSNSSSGGGGGGGRHYNNVTVKFWGGRSSSSPSSSSPDHGLFSTNHGCLYDPLADQIGIADRENGRIEYFNYYKYHDDYEDKNNDDDTVNNYSMAKPQRDTRNLRCGKEFGRFDYSHTTDLRRKDDVDGENKIFESMSYIDQDRPGRHQATQEQQKELGAVALSPNAIPFSRPSLGNASRPCIVRRQVSQTTAYSRNTTQHEPPENVLSDQDDKDDGTSFSTSTSSTTTTTTRLRRVGGNKIQCSRNSTNKCTTVITSTTFASATAGTRSTRSEHRSTRQQQRQPEQQQQRYGVIPDLAGKVAVILSTTTNVLEGKSTNGNGHSGMPNKVHDEVLYVIDVAGTLGHLGHLHPHDAQMLPNGDVIVATWNPGRLSYWKRVKIEDGSEMG